MPVIQGIVVAAENENVIVEVCQYCVRVILLPISYLSAPYTVLTSVCD